jgi:hypothetical protein
MEDAIELEKPFSEMEVKHVVWGYDSFKSLGPYDISFSFLNELWEEVKGEFVQLLLEFYANEK